MACRGRRRRNRGKERFWRQVVREWHGSGLSIRAFCSERGISEQSLYYWRRELALRDREHGLGNGESTFEQPAFVPVRVFGSAAIEVVVRSGQTVRVAAGFEPAHLRAVVAALEEPSC